MSGSIRLEPVAVRISMTRAVSPDAGHQSGHHAPQPGSAPIFSAMMAIAQNSSSELTDAKKQLESDLDAGGLAKGLVYTMLGAVDAKLAQPRISVSRIDASA